jgi:hypothetical protein
MYLTLQRTVIWMVIVSVVSSFFLQALEFPVGGVFGQAVSEWIQKFLGIPGTVALLVFALVATFVWNNNPDLSDFTWRQLWYETQRAWRDLLSGEYGKRRTCGQTRSALVKKVDRSSETAHSPTRMDPLQIAPPRLSPQRRTRKSSVPPRRSDVVRPHPEKCAFCRRRANLRKKGDAIEDTELEINLPPQHNSPHPCCRDDAHVLQAARGGHSGGHAQPLEPYDPTLELSHYEYPHLQLLHEYDNSGTWKLTARNWSQQKPDSAHADELQD